MKQFIIFCVILLSSTNLFASTTDCSATKTCAANYFCTISTSSCSECEAPYIDSVAGATGRTDCYATCDAPTKINYGDKKANAPTVAYNTAGTVCAYTSVCHIKPDNIPLFTVVVDKCVPVTGVQCTVAEKPEYSKSCTKEWKPTNKDNGTDGSWKFNITCNEKFTLIDGACEPEKKPCLDIFSPLDVKGNAILDMATNPPSYNKKTCYIEKTTGSEKEACFYTNDDAQGKPVFDKCYFTNITSCNDGFYLEKYLEIYYACVLIEKGYYKDPATNTSNLKPPLKCPGGTTTSNLGSTSIRLCHIASGVDGTQFCDAKGCFTLPASVGSIHVK